jgi:hypothetical protein
MKKAFGQENGKRGDFVTRRVFREALIANAFTEQDSTNALEPAIVVVRAFQLDRDRTS